MKYFNESLSTVEFKAPKIKKMKKEYDFQEFLGKKKLNKPKRFSTKRQDQFQ